MWVLVGGTGNRCLRKGMEVLEEGSENAGGTRWRRKVVEVLEEGAKVA